MGRVVASAATVLTSTGAPSPRADAELLAGYVLNVPRGRLVLAAGFDRRQRREYEDLVARRSAGVPVQHLTGTAGFRHLDLAVGPGVFVPRPETELLVEAGLRALADAADPVVVDLCAGSGAVGLSVAHERADATVYLVESDPAALTYLRRNAAAVDPAGSTTVGSGSVGSPTAVAAVENVATDRVAADRAGTSGVAADRAGTGGVAADRPGTGGGRVRVLAADATRPVPGLPAGAVDAVLANPPYIPVGTVLPADVAGADPDRALYGGADGLSVIRPLVARAAELLRAGGLLAVEHDDTHGTAVPELVRADGHYTDISDHPDLAGRPRYTTARRR